GIAFLSEGLDAFALLQDLLDRLHHGDRGIGTGLIAGRRGGHVGSFTRGRWCCRRSYHVPAEFPCRLPKWKRRMLRACRFALTRRVSEGSRLRVGLVLRAYRFLRFLN